MPVRNGNLGSDRTKTTKAASVRKQLGPKNSKSNEGRQAKNGGVKRHAEGKTTSLLVQIYNRIRMLVMLQIMWVNISYQLYVITKISAIISRYFTAKFEQ